MGNPEGHRGGPAGSCRRPTRARRHEPAAPSLIVTTAAYDRLRFRTLRDAQREGAGRVMIGGVHDDFVLAALRERRGETGMAVAARFVVLEVAAARYAGPAQEQIRIERVGFEVDGDRLPGAPLNRPRLRVGAVAREHYVVATELPLLCLADRDRVLAGAGTASSRARPLAAGGIVVIARRARALRDREREAARLPLGRRRRVHQNPVGAPAGARAGHARRAARSAVVVDDGVVEIV